jgi:conjugal transfer/entry exclusion protein
MEQVAQMRTTNGKLESDLEFQKKNQKLYAKQLDEAESEAKKQAGAVQKAKGQLDALQARFDQLSSQLIEQQGELSRLK